MKAVLDSLIKTLCEIEVKGKDNLNMLLGCILTLEKLRDACTTKTETIEVKAGEGNENHDEQRQDV